MQPGLFALYLTGAYPVWRAWQANRRTSLSHAVHWMAAAWAAWAGLAAYRGTAGIIPGLGVPRYLALALTGCAGVAVLGARRPGVAAWNFVLFGLLAVMLLPVAESLIATAEPLGFFRGLFLGATLAVGVFNYLPTRLAPAALALALGCVGEFILMLDEPGAAGNAAAIHVLGMLALGLTPWVGLLAWRGRPRPPSEFDRLWLDFRDRFGLVWGQRVREQFNRAAANAGWPVHLYWQGLLLTSGAAPLGSETRTAIVATLRALLKRFSEEPDDASAERSLPTE